MTDAEINELIVKSIDNAVEILLARVVKPIEERLTAVEHRTELHKLNDGR